MGVISTYNNDGGYAFYVYNDVNDTQSYETYTNAYDASGNLTGQTGAFDNGNLWSGPARTGPGRVTPTLTRTATRTGRRSAT